jgi:thiamine-monophosphate kinase
MSEFQLIRRLQEIICLPDHDHRPDCVIGIGDDAAVLEVPAGQQLVVCTDTLVAGIHFPPGTSPRAIGHKSLAVNLSDLAAMGAVPAWFFMALSMPGHDQDWLEEFAQGMADLAKQVRISLAGGDVTGGSLSICITALGLVEKGQALTRAGAQQGDLVLVSGRPGAAANALKILASGGKPRADDLDALEYPQPRLDLGRALNGIATSCIDLSDGLLADLGHILEQSGGGAELDLDCLPCPPGLEDLPAEKRWPLQLAGGDDYELCFTARPSSLDQLDSIAAACGVEITVIGSITGGAGIKLRKPGGGLYEPVHSGYEHFQETDEAGE